MTERTLVEVLDRLEHSVAGLVIEIKGIHTHSGSSWYFLQCTAEDLLEAVRELRAALPAPEAP